MATKGRPFTVRLRPEVERRLEEEARRTRRPKTVMLEALADEALRMRRFPGIGFRGPEHDRRAWVMGTGLDMWELIELHRDGGESILENHPISRRQLGVALAYYGEYSEEIDRHLQENDRTPEEWHEMYPGVIPPPGTETAG
ncbi:MAG: hypothetical protein M3P86_01985 [Actinomycetota bacterium]|nr:hypothetical protein [Actinomycetota bacterium]